MLKEQRRGQKGETHTPKIEAQSNHKEFSLALFFTFFSLCEKETQRWVPSRPLCDLARGQNSNPTHTGRMWLPVDGSGKRLMEGGGISSLGILYTPKSCKRSFANRFYGQGLVVDRVGRSLSLHVIRKRYSQKSESGTI